MLLFRIRFPDGWLLQGTFAVQENLSAVSEFVSEHLETPLPHVLADSVTGQKFRLGEEGTLAELGFTQFCRGVELFLLLTRSGSCCTSELFLGP